MPPTDIYARCNFTRSGQPNIRFNVVIKVQKDKLEELRQIPANRDQTDNQLLGTTTFSDDGSATSLRTHWLGAR